MGTAAREKEETEARTAKTHKDMLMQWKVDALERAQQFRENDRKESYRQINRKKKEEERLRRFRETQFLDTLRGRNMTQRQSDEQLEDEDEDMAGKEQTAPPGGFVTKKEAAQFQKSFEQEERQKRHAEREEKKREQEAKKGKVQDLKAKDPNAAEILRVKQWRKEENSKKTKTEAARVAKEIAQEQEQRNMQAEER